VHTGLAFNLLTLPVATEPMLALLPLLASFSMTASSVIPLAKRHDVNKLWKITDSRPKVKVGGEGKRSTQRLLFTHIKHCVKTMITDLTIHYAD